MRLHSLTKNWRSIRSHEGLAEFSGSSLEAGRAAVRGREWERAFAVLSAADADAALGPEDLEALGDAAWVTSRYDEFFRAYERAYAAYVEQDETHAAAWVATTLANEHFPRGELAVGASEPTELVSVRWK
jgi:hypothetical protein